MSGRAPAWLEAARCHPSVEMIGDAWRLIVQAISVGEVDADGLVGLTAQLRAGGDVVHDGLALWPSGDAVIVEVGDGSATVDRAALLDVLQAITEDV